MQILTRDEFLSKKKSDTIVVYGSGYSINDITEEQWNKLGQFDSIGFNWFLKSKRPVTFYLLREQDIWRKNGFGDESRKEVVDTLNNYYKDSCAIVVDLSNSHPKWSKTNHYGKKIYQKDIKLSGVISKEVFARISLPEYRNGWPENNKRYNILCNYFQSYDMLNKGIVYDFCSMVNILHLITFLKYKRIIFAGVDLYDHRYFWLGKDKLRNITKKRGRKLNSNHFVSNFTCGLIGTYNNYFKDVELFVLNPKSLLAKKIKIWSF